jgi:hypothetical protein
MAELFLWASLFRRKARDNGAHNVLGVRFFWLVFVVGMVYAIITKR